MGNNI